MKDFKRVSTSDTMKSRSFPPLITLLLLLFFAHKRQYLASVYERHNDAFAFQKSMSEANAILLLLHVLHRSHLKENCP